MHDVDIGRMNQRITFCQYVESESETGNLSQKLAPVKTVWATVNPMRGREYIEMQKLTQESFCKIYTRFFDFVTQDMWILHGNKQYEIQSVIDIESRHRLLEILCKEGKADGRIVPVRDGTE